MSDNVTDRIKEQQSLKWPKLIWSVAILLALTIYLEKQPYTGENILGIFGWFMIIWPVSLLALILICILRVFRLIARENFLYIFLGTIGLYTGICGLLFASGDIKRDLPWLLLFGLTILFSSFIFIDVYIYEIPGFNKRLKKIEK